MLNIITNGYILPFMCKPNLARFPLIQSGYKALQKDQAYPVSSVKERNIKGRKCKISRFYSRLFLVPKRHQWWRPVIDLSRLNTFLLVEKFKMETPESIRTSLIPGEWVSSIDLSDAYLHIPFHPNSRKYLTQSLGWIINQEKSKLKPTQVFSFGGFEYHLDSALVKPTQERWLKPQDLILRLKSKHVLTARCLMSLIGLLASMEKMVPEGRLHLRPFQFHLKEHWRYPQSLDKLLPLTETISAHLEWWQNLTNVMKGADLHPKDHSIHSLQTPQTKAGALT